MNGTGGGNLQSKGTASGIRKQRKCGLQTFRFETILKKGLFDLGQDDSIKTTKDVAGTPTSSGGTFENTKRQKVGYVSKGRVR